VKPRPALGAGELPPGRRRLGAFGDLVRRGRLRGHGRHGCDDPSGTGETSAKKSSEPQALGSGEVPLANARSFEKRHPCVGRGGGGGARSVCNSGTFSAAIQPAMPCFQTNVPRASEPSRTLADKVSRSKGPACLPLTAT